MTDLTDLDAILGAPVAVGMALPARASGAVAEVLADPVTATALAASVTSVLTPWSQPQALRRWLVDQGAALRPLVTELVRKPTDRLVATATRS